MNAKIKFEIRITCYYFFSIMCISSFHIKLVHAGSLSMDNLTELTTDSGVTIEKVLLKDGTVRIGTTDSDGKLLIVTSAPSGSPTVDQSNSGGETPGLAINTGRWQSFTAGLSGYMTQIEIYGNSASGWEGVYTLKIRKGEGSSGTILSTDTNWSWGSSSTYAWKSLTLSNPPFLESGNKYTWQIVRTSTYSGGLSYSTGNPGPYAGGYFYSGGNYYDFDFKIYVDVLANHNTLFIDSGNVGIGTKTPGYNLEVNGSAAKTGGGTWADSSDIRLKKNISDLNSQDALDTICKLNGVIYEWINPEEHSEGTRAGIIAQELENVFPEWVTERYPSGKDNDLIPSGRKIKSIQFPHDFNAYMIEAIKELNIRINELEEEVRTLKEENKRLRLKNR